jgi:hypothetical protein
MAKTHDPTGPVAPMLPVPPSLPGPPLPAAMVAGAVLVATRRAARRPLIGRLAALAFLLPLVAVANGYAAFAYLERARLLGDELPAMSDVVAADDRVATAFVVVILLHVATAMVWLAWQYGHAANAERLGHSPQLGRGWAIGGWFVPVANLVMPVQQLLDSARASATGPHPVVYGGWATFVAGGLLTVTGFWLHSSDVGTADHMRGAGSAVLGLAAVLALTVAWTSTSRQHRTVEA